MVGCNLVQELKISSKVQTFSHMIFYIRFLHIIYHMCVFTFITESVISSPRITALSRNECLVEFTILVSVINIVN